MTRNPGAATWASVAPIGLDWIFGEPEVDDEFVVGVIDTGVVLLDGKPHDYIGRNLDEASRRPENEDELASRLLPLDPTDGHGTFVIGRVLLEAPTVRICMRRAIGTAGPENDRAVAERIDELAGMSRTLKLVNLSFFGDDTEPPVVIRNALANLLQANPDVIVVIAAGNRWSARPAYPAAFNQDDQIDPVLRRRIVAVGAIDESIIPGPGLPPPRASFSNCWSGIDVYASGVQVVGPRATPTDAGWRFGWSAWSGTSFAAATVTGVLARRIQAGQKPEDALTDIRNGDSTFPPLPGVAEDKPIVWAADRTWPQY